MSVLGVTVYFGVCSISVPQLVGASVPLFIWL